MLTKLYQLLIFFGMICLMFLIVNIISERAGVPIEPSKWFQTAPAPPKYSDEEIFKHLLYISFPLFKESRNEKGPILIDGCTGWNAALTESGNFSVYISAGHCQVAGVKIIRVGGKSWWATFVSSDLMNSRDFVAGDKPFCSAGEKIATFPKFTSAPDHGVFHKGETYYYLAQNGVRDGSTVVIERRLGKLIYDHHDPISGEVFLLGDPQMGKTFDLFCATDTCGYRVVPGTSGGVVINKDLQAVGLIRGFNVLSYHEVFVISAEHFLPAIHRLQNELKTWNLAPNFCETASSAKITQ